MVRFFFFFVFLFSLQAADAQQNFFVKKDLKEDWLLYDGQSFTPIHQAHQEDYKVIYIPVSAAIFKRDHFMAEDVEPFSIFVNGKLIFDRQTKVIASVDSLYELAGGQALMISVYRNRRALPAMLKTWMVAYLPAGTENTEGPFVRTPQGFKDFVIVTALFLTIFFVVIFRLNPKQTAHYFSVVKLFSLRESEDSQPFNRITSSANVLYYVFLSFVAAFVLILLLSVRTATFTLSPFLPDWDFVELVFHWIRWSLFIFIMLALKAVGIAIFAVLFKIFDQSGFQFVSFIRLLLVTMVLVATVITTFYILKVEQEAVYLFFYRAIGWMLAGWLILVFMKLLRRVHFSAFHLFSYICATEIIPILLATKILYE